ncbi:MAG TPA: thiamine phosphate synthase [Streptosporangiaceae bacterium]|nr:thiamine phosphate synthase [Streptosporangiaceae bacterium]
MADSGGSERDGADLRGRLASARLYLCTDGRERQGDLSRFLDRVVGGGVDIVQLRQKGLEAADELRLLEVFRAVCDRHDAMLAVNDRADIAYAAGADVLHLGQADLRSRIARQVVGDRTVIGLSTHSSAQADAAAADPHADYFCAGPVWTTPTKPGRPAAGLGLISYVAGLAATRPWFAIGGIDEATIGDVIEAGARRVVVVRAITEAEDPGAAAARLARVLDSQ